MDPLSEHLPHISELSSVLERSVCIVDIETTGFGHNAGVVQIAMLTVGPKGIVESFETLIKPDVSIDPRASNVHGIYAENVKRAPRFQDIASVVRDRLSRSVVCGFNSNSCDIPVLTNSLIKTFNRDFVRDVAQYRLDVRKLWTNVSRSQKGRLSEVAAFYGVKGETAHDALGDVLTTSRLLEQMIDRHSLSWVADSVQNVH